MQASERSGFFLSDTLFCLSGDGVLIPVAKDKKGKDIKKKGVPTKRLEPMHTPVPHDHDGTRAHLGGATPTTVLESALKQVTFTAILPVR